MAEARPTTYTVYPTGFDEFVNFDKHYWTVEVTDGQGGYGWAVRRIGMCLNRDLYWEHEPLPSSRDATFFERCRWAELEVALEAAKTVVDNLRINGCTAQQASDDVAERLATDG